MHPIMTGFLAGAMSGIVMGLASDILFRLHVFRSSIILIDGSFLFRMLNLKTIPSFLYAAGFCIHLLTSGIFGAIYTAAAALLGFDSLSFGLISLYSAALWLSMLFIALPVAGEGFLGRKSGPLTWLEQLVLHAIYCVLYYACLMAFL